MKERVLVATRLVHRVEVQTGMYVFCILALTWVHYDTLQCFWAEMAC